MKRRMRIGLIVAGLGFASLAAAGVALGALQNPGACTGDTSTVTLYENAPGDTGDGNDTYWVCTAKANLASVAHSLPGNCNTGIGGNSTWNDCVSSAYVDIPSGYRACFYRSADYSVPLTTYGNIVGPAHARYTFSGFNNDSLSSVKITTGSCP